MLVLTLYDSLTLTFDILGCGLSQWSSGLPSQSSIEGRSQKWPEANGWVKNSYYRSLAPSPNPNPTQTFYNSGLRWRTFEMAGCYRHRL